MKKNPLIHVPRIWDGQMDKVQKVEIPEISRNDLFYKFVDSTAFYGV